MITAIFVFYVGFERIMYDLSSEYIEIVNLICKELALHNDCMT